MATDNKYYDLARSFLIVHPETEPLREIFIQGKTPRHYRDYGFMGFALPDRALEVCPTEHIESVGFWLRQLENGEFVNLYGVTEEFRC